MSGGKDVSIITSNRCARGLICVYCSQETGVPGVKDVSIVARKQVCPGVKMCLL